MWTSAWEWARGAASLTPPSASSSTMAPHMRARVLAALALAALCAALAPGAAAAVVVGRVYRPVVAAPLGAHPPVRTMRRAHCARECTAPVPVLVAFAKLHPALPSAADAR